MPFTVSGSPKRKNAKATVCQCGLVSVVEDETAENSLIGGSNVERGDL